jgi:hypothetical protein
MRKQPIGTLADLVESGQGLYLHCEACGYSARMDLKALARTHGETMLIARIGRRAVCTRCKARAPDVVAVCPSAR